VSFWRRSLGRALIMVVQAVFTRGIGIISSGLLARLLTPTDWGSVQAVVQAAGTMTQTLKLSVDTGLQIRLSETQRQPEESTPGELLGAALLVLGLLSALAVVLGVFLSGFAARLFGEPALEPFMGWTGWLAAGQLIAQIAGALFAFGAFRAGAFTQVGVNSCYLIMLLVAYALHVRGLWLGLSTQLFLQLGIGLTYLALTLRAGRALSIRPTLKRFWSSERELLRIGLPMHAAAAVPSIVSLFVSAYLARTSGLPALAELRVVGAMNQLVAFLPQSMAVTFLTEFAGARGSEAQVSRHDFSRYIRIIVASAILAATSGAWMSNWLVPLAFGDHYTAAVKLVSIGVATALVNATKQALLVGLMSERKTGYALADSFVSSLMYAPLAMFLTPKLGVAGLLLAELVSQLTTLLLLGSILSSRFTHADSARPAFKALSALVVTITVLLLTYFVYDRPGSWLGYVPALIGLSLSVPWVLFTQGERTALVQTLRARFRARSSTPG